MVSLFIKFRFHSKNNICTVSKSHPLYMHCSPSLSLVYQHFHQYLSIVEYNSPSPEMLPTRITWYFYLVTLNPFDYPMCQNWFSIRLRSGSTLNKSCFKQKLGIRNTLRQDSNQYKNSNWVCSSRDSLYLSMSGKQIHIDCSTHIFCWKMCRQKPWSPLAKMIFHPILFTM